MEKILKNTYEMYNFKYKISDKITISLLKDDNTLIKTYIINKKYIIMKKHVDYYNYKNYYKRLYYLANGNILELVHIGRNIHRAYYEEIDKNSNHNFKYVSNLIIER